MTLDRKTLQDASKLATAIVDETSKVIVGKPASIRYAVYGMLANGHCLFEDVPGVAKTMLVKTLARVSGLDFQRIQFTPDLLPADVSGSYIFNTKTREFELRKGPLFAQIVLGDELNRAPPKTQSALLEAMQEKQVTLEGTTHTLPKPFFVYATQNPIESEGVYALPEAELDRFLIRISLGYPEPDEEVEVLRRIEAWNGKEPVVRKVCTAAQLLKAQEATRSVYVHDDLKRYIVGIVHATRMDDRIAVGASPRGSIALLALVKAAAIVAGRDHAIDDDVKEVAQAALAHRLILKPEAAARGTSPEQIIETCLDLVPTPKVPSIRA
jgi:MoxR-like ATPase